MDYEIEHHCEHVDNYTYHIFRDYGFMWFLSNEQNPDKHHLVMFLIHCPFCGVKLPLPPLFKEKKEVITE